MTGQYNDYRFVNIDTDTVDPVAGGYILNVADLTRQQAETLADCDAFGTFSDTGRDIIMAVAVPLPALIVAWQWRESLRAAGILDDVEDYVVRCCDDMDIDGDDRVS